MTLAVLLLVAQAIASPLPTGTTCPETQVTIRRNAPEPKGGLASALMSIAPSQGFVYVAVTVTPDGTIKEASIKKLQRKCQTGCAWRQTRK